MAVTPVIPNAIKVAFKWAMGSQTAVTTFGITTSTTDLAAVAAQIASHVQAPMWGPVLSQARVVEQHLFRYDGTTPTFVAATTGTQWDGQDAGSDAVVAVSYLISFRTAERGQWARGRIYLPFIGEGSQNSGFTIPATVTPMQQAWDAFRTAMSSGGTPLAVISLANHPELNPPHTPAARLVISSTVEALLATQRRRQQRLRRA